MLKLDSLRTFVAVANAGNIAEAAESVGRTPSAVSMTLKALEAEIGAPLFETDRKNLLTPLGRFTLETAAAQIRGYDTAVAAIRAFAANRIGRLTIAAVPSVATHILPACLNRFLRDQPGLELDLRDADSRSVSEAVDGGIVEIGLAGAPAATARLDFAPLFRDRFRVVCPAAHRLAGLGRPLVWQDLTAERFIRNAAADTIEFPELRTAYFAWGLVVRNVASLLAMVETGQGITLLPALATLGMGPGLIALDVDLRGTKRVAGVITRKDQRISPAAAAFLHLLTDALAAQYDAFGIEPVD
jgi:DNA-binding transcriptional LysR family regulator